MAEEEKMEGGEEVEGVEMMERLRIQTDGEGLDRAAMIEELRLGLYEAQRERSYVDLAGASAVAVGGTEDVGEQSPRNGVVLGESPSRSARRRGGPEKLGTLWGVFIPCLQNILGVILFLRLTSITAQAGTFGTTGIIAACASSTFITALSLSAVATNGRVAAGGPYFVISRNLGPEVGTAVGLLFYLGTTIAASMYVLGAVETLYDGFADLLTAEWEMRRVTTALVLMLVLAYIVLVGVRQVNAASSVFLAIVLFSVASSLVGICVFAATGSSGALGPDNRGSPRARPKWRRDNDLGTTPDFQVLIALFYPSVTGIMAGSNRSGVLASPSRSIPTGTLAAIAVTTTLYVVVVWAFGTTVDRDYLYDQKLAVALVAWPSVAVVKIGIILSSVGAALQSLTGAPRLLHAIASDGTMPILAGLLPARHRDDTAASRVAASASASRAAAAAAFAGTPVGRLATKAKPSNSPTRRALVEPDHKATLSSFLADKLRSKIRLSLPTPAAAQTSDDLESAASQSPPARPDATSPTDSADADASPAASQHQQQQLEMAPTKTAASATTTKKRKETSDVTTLAVGITWFIASIPCLAGKLDAITPIVTMFFLLMYATVNLACFFLAYLRSPGFRPTWKYFHWSSALAGFVWCLGLMFYIDVVYAVVAIFIGSCTALYVRKEGVSKDWGDASAGVRFQIARDQLLALTERSTFHHTKNWRPQILVMCNLDPRFNPKRPELLALAGCLKKGQGLLMAHALLDASAHAARSLVADAATEVLRLHLHDHHIQGFPRAVVYRDRTASGAPPDAADDRAGLAGPGNDDDDDLALRKKMVVHERKALFDAMLASAQACGVGALRPNTLLLGWPRASPRDALADSCGASCGSPSSRRAHRADFVQTLRDISAMRKALIVLKGGEALATGRPLEEGKTIDIWWVVQDGGLLLLLPWLLLRSKLFGNCRLRVFAVMTGLFAHYWNAPHGGAEAVQTGDVDSESLYLERFQAFVSKMLADVRITAEVHPVAGLDFVWAAAHVYRDTLGLRGRTTYDVQVSNRVGDRPLSPVAKFVRHVASASPKSLRSLKSQRSSSSAASGDADPPKHDRLPTSLPFENFPFQSPVVLVGTDDDKLAPIRGFAHALNRKMRRFSASAALVVTNLPYMTHLPPTFFVDYVDSLTEGLDSVVLVRGSGKEVVTKYG